MKSVPHPAKRDFTAKRFHPPKADFTRPKGRISLIKALLSGRQKALFSWSEEERFGFDPIAALCLRSAPTQIGQGSKHGARNRNRSDGADRQLAESAALRPFPGARCESLLYIFATKKHPHGVFFCVKERVKVHQSIERMPKSTPDQIVKE